jgi:glycine oxidase
VHRGDDRALASFNNPGGLNPLYGAGIPGPLEGLALRSFELHINHWDDIARSAGTHFTREKKKRLNLAVDDADVSRLESLHERYRSTPGFSARWVDGRDLKTLEPSVDGPVTVGLVAEGDARVDAAAYTQGVLRAAERAGVRKVDAEVTGLDHDGSGVVNAVRLGSDSLACSAVVVATGPWTEAADWLGIDLPLEPIKGDLLTVRTERGLNMDIAWREAAAYRREGAEVCLGGTEERRGFDDEPSASARSSIIERISEVLPGLARGEITSQSTGLRPVTSDGLPVLGRPPGWSNVCLALGGGRKGMLLASALGAAASDLLTQGRTNLPVDAFSPDRFMNGETGVAS